MELASKVRSGIPGFSCRLLGAPQGRAKGVNSYPVCPPLMHTHTHAHFQSIHLLTLATNGLHQCRRRRRHRRVLHFPGEVTTSISFHQPDPPRDHFIGICFTLASRHAKRQAARRPSMGRRALAWRPRRVTIGSVNGHQFSE